MNDDKEETMDTDEYVVVANRGDVPVAGPYSERQASRVARATMGGAKVARIVRPTYWLDDQEDLERFRMEPSDA